MGPPRGPRPRASEGQRRTLFKYLRDHPSIAVGYKRTPAARKLADAQWEEVAALLNAHGDGVRKNAKQWCKFYNDFKSKLKAKKLALINRSATGGDSSPLATDEHNFAEQMLDIIGERAKQEKLSSSLLVNFLAQAPTSEADDSGASGDIADFSVANFEQEMELPLNKRNFVICDMSQEAAHSTSSETQPALPLQPPPKLLALPEAIEARLPPPEEPSPRVREVVRGHVGHHPLPPQHKKPDARHQRRLRATAKVRPRPPGQSSIELKESKRVESDMSVARSLQVVLEALKSHTAESLRVQRTQAEALERYAAAAERQAAVAERQLQLETDFYH